MFQILTEEVTPRSTKLRSQLDRYLGLNAPIDDSRAYAVRLQGTTRHTNAVVLTPSRDQVHKLLSPL
jgi:hypothetical protein